MPVYSIDSDWSKHVSCLYISNMGRANILCLKEISIYIATKLQQNTYASTCRTGLFWDT